MTPLAFHPKLVPPPPSAPSAQTASAASGGEASFAAVLHGLDTPDVQAKIKGPKGSPAQARDSIANSSEDAMGTAAPSPSIEAALAALGYPAPALSTAAEVSAPKGAAAPVAIAPALSGSVLPPSALAEPVEAASPPNAPFVDPTLGLQTLRSRTHLAVAVSARAPQAAPLVGAPPAAAEIADAAQPKPLNLSNSQTQVAQSVEASPGNGIGALGSAAGAYAVSPRAKESLTTRSAAVPRTRGAPASQPGFTGARGVATAGPGSPSESNAVSQTSGESAQSSRDGSKSGGDGASIAASDVTLAPPNAAAGAGMAGPAPLGVNQLADFIATEAASLTAESASTPGAQPSTNSAPQSVTEMEIALDPADLGAVSIRMRYANGKLTVVIGAANASTRQAIESDREAIAERLTSPQHPLEALIIQSADPTPVPSGGNDASDSNDPRQNAANGDPASGGSRASRGAPNGRGQGATAAPASRGGSGDLTV